MPFFSYSSKETDALKAKDPVLGAAIDKIGPIEREVIPDLFEALTHAVVGQQISTKAQVTVWNRFKEAYPAFTPQVASSLTFEELQSFGVSRRKAEYIKEIAEKVLSGELDLNALKEKNDEEVVSTLSSLRGIGVWTAEMLLLFSLERPDVLSYGDLGICRGLRMLYRHRKITPQLFSKYKRRLSPYGSVASLYLWAISGGALEGLTDPGEVKKKAKAKK